MTPQAPAILPVSTELETTFRDQRGANVFRIGMHELTLFEPGGAAKVCKSSEYVCLHNVADAVMLCWTSDAIVDHLVSFLKGT